jgi:hypothetical protein
LVITTRNGLLYLDGRGLDLHEADRIAQAYGRRCAEHLVSDLEAGVSIQSTPAAMAERRAQADLELTLMKKHAGHDELREKIRPRVNARE